MPMQFNKIPSCTTITIISGRITTVTITCSTMNGKERRLDYQCWYSLIRFLTEKALLRHSSATDAITSKSWPQRNAGKVVYPNAHQNGHNKCVRIRRATQDTQWNEKSNPTTYLYKRDVIVWNSGRILCHDLENFRQRQAPKRAPKRTQKMCPNWPSCDAGF